MSKKLLEFLDSKLVRASLIIIGVLLVFFGQDIYNSASAEQKNVIDPVTGELDPYYKIDPKPKHETEPYKRDHLPMWGKGIMGGCV